VSELDSTWTAGMPQELAAAMSNLHPTLREAAIDGWQSAGVRGRQRCCDFVNAGRSDWTRQLRCRIVLRRLIGAAAPWL
jgi:hypothetical protein